MQIFNTLKQSKYLKFKLAVATLAITTLLFGIIPNKTYFICAENNQSLETTVVVLTYAYGLKHTVDNYSLRECQTSNLDIYCHRGKTSVWFDRLNADFDTVTGGLVTLQKCTQTKLKI
jgi:hypothetical protein